MSSLSLKLFILHLLLSDFLLQFLFFLINRLDSLLSILIKLSNLILKSLLVLFILLLVFALYDLLSLLGDSIQLNILSSLFEIMDLKVKFLLLVSNFFKPSFKVRDILHEINFGLSSLTNLLILILNDISLNKNSILIVSSNWQLRYFYLALLEVYDNLKVILQLVYSFISFLMSSKCLLVLIIDLISKILEM